MHDMHWYVMKCSVVQVLLLLAAVGISVVCRAVMMWSSGMDAVLRWIVMYSCWCNPTINDGDFDQEYINDRFKWTISTKVIVEGSLYSLWIKSECKPLCLSGSPFNFKLGRDRAFENSMVYEGKQHPWNSLTMTHSQNWHDRKSRK